MAGVHLPVMQVTIELVEKAEAAGVQVGAVYTYGDADYMDITVQAFDPADTPRPAEALGLTDYTSPTEDHRHEAWQAHFGPAWVRTHRPVAAEVPA